MIECMLRSKNEQFLLLILLDSRNKKCRKIACVSMHFKCCDEQINDFISRYELFIFDVIQIIMIKTSSGKNNVFLMCIR